MKRLTEVEMQVDRSHRLNREPPVQAIGTVLLTRLAGPARSSTVRPRLKSVPPALLSRLRSSRTTSDPSIPSIPSRHGRCRDPASGVSLEPGVDLLSSKRFEQVAHLEPHDSDQDPRGRVALLASGRLVVEGNLDLVRLVHLEHEVLHPPVRARGVRELLDDAVDLELDRRLVERFRPREGAA